MKLFRQGFFVTAMASLLAAGAGQAAEEKIEAKDLPSAVAKTVRGRFPGLEFVSIAKESENGLVVFDIELKQKGRKFETDIKEDGTMMEVEKEVVVKDWPKALKSAIEKKYSKTTIKEVMEVNLVKDKKETPDHLEVTIETADQKESEVIASLDGTNVTVEAAAEAPFTSEFSVGKGELVSSGRNPYFILEPGYQQTYKEGGEQLVITVLSETKNVAGVETRVVEERETKDGQLVEVSRNYFAISKRTNSVFYFGEDVDIYEGGKIANHGGSWLAGIKGANYGLMMPGEVLLGGRYYQEVAPDVAMDRAEIVSMNETVKTPAGEYKNCLKIEETTPLEAGNKEFKYYAPGIGLVQDDSLKLVKTGTTEKPVR